LVAILGRERPETRETREVERLKRRETEARGTERPEEDRGTREGPEKLPVQRCLGDIRSRDWTWRSRPTK
jgi:hypothetical protein